MNTHNFDNPLYIVRIESIRFFDDSQYSYLPYFNEIFGVYTDEQQAKNAVWAYFGSSDDYEIIIDECDDIDNVIISNNSDVFKYVDKTYGGVAYYIVSYHVEWIIKPDCKKRSLTQTHIDNGQDAYINKAKLKVWKELETKRLNMQLISNENIPHITNKQLDDAVENKLVEMYKNDFDNFIF